MPSSFFPNASMCIACHMHFYNTDLTHISGLFQVPDHEQNVKIFVESTAPFLGLPNDLRLMVNSHLTGTLKKEGASVSKQRAVENNSPVLFLSVHILLFLAR